MSTTVTRYNDVAVLTIKGELTADTLESFVDSAAQCRAGGSRNFVVDFSMVTAIDSEGLEALLDVQDKCEDEYGNVKLCGLDETAQKILEITRLDRRFEVFGDLDATVKSFA